MRSSLSDRLSVALSALLIAALCLGMFLVPKSDFSERENRALAPLPSLRLSSLLRGELSSSLSDYYGDHFPLRTQFTACKATVERWLGKRENNGILFGKEGYLIPRDEYDSLAVARENLLSCQEFLGAQSTTAKICILPRAVDVLNLYLPDGYDTERATSIHALTDELLPSALSVTDTLRAAAEDGSYVWYKTDHHWTSDGAFLAYQTLAPSLGITPLSADAFTPVTVSERFLGTSFSKSGLAKNPPDTVTLYRYENDERFEVYNDETQSTRYGFYHTERLSEKDQYLVFLGGNFARLTVRDPDAENKPKMLLFKDSFANAMIPFLALHFDLDVIDLRYYQGSVSELLTNNHYDQILLLMGADTLATTPAWKKLNR